MAKQKTVQRIVVQGEELWLLPERALYWPDRRTLLLADPHFGKGATFRSGGIPVPGGTTAGNLRRLERAIARSGAQRLICLGDLLHARAGRAEGTMEAVSRWRQQRPGLDWWLVRGNHDRHAGDPPSAWQITCVDEPWVEGPFVFCHFPEASPLGYVLAGHLHPAVQLGRGKLAETLPCFYFGDRVGILPAFGEFTGTATIRPEVGDQIFVAVEDEVIAL